MNDPHTTVVPPLAPASTPEDLFQRTLAELLEAEERGQRPDLSQVLQKYPQLDAPLRAFFRNRDGFDRLAPCLARPIVGVGADSDLTRGSRVGDYEVLEEVGRGGRGIVYRVNDSRLQRALAIKVLSPELRDEPDAVRRFVEEVQVTGRLQHPGIVPVHAIGQLPDGRPYFAMKLVEGRTLAALLAQRQAPTHDLPRFLGIFQQTCQAVAYAHRQGVIHRDLKPANVMVGAFAEVQVMDWGLAKVLRKEEAGSRNVETGSDHSGSAASPFSPPLSSAADTQTGTVVGTFAYMSPEQARGEVEKLDARTDVFGLGAILCEILTGLPPYTGGNAGELCVLAAAGDLSDAFSRLHRCRAGTELVALARTCLAAERTGRPRDAGEVAERVAAIRVKPDYAEAYCNLGQIVQDQGRFAEALELLRLGHALGSRVPGWPYASAEWVRQCERFIELDKELPAILSGKAEATSAAERLALGQLCHQCKHRYTLAVRFYADAFAADPKLAADLGQQHRYNAACSAALAAAGQGEDAKNLPDTLQLTLRRQALDWLQADLALRARQLGTGRPEDRAAVQAAIQHWQIDPDLARLRDKAGLAKLPDSERQAWEKLWADVAALQRRARETK
jgi:serine/threonine protein kinase